MQTSPPHRPGGNKRQSQGGGKTPQSTAEAENHSASPSHSFVCSQEVFRKELKEKSLFSAALGFITRPACFQSFRFKEKEQKGGGGENLFKEVPPSLLAFLKTNSKACFASFEINSPPPHHFLIFFFSPSVVSKR
ncbi:hypothetical protein CEXT_15551 [Caerostris extrusa]|uniref:Uncharacterized protein n=1 Tax=Caerostris extrusa TaxID=172846 RepID=A0AAV4MDU2_CAEEX|nr:hypothetical protein CEXT_15551 [Caerostris extrusa]